MFNYNHLHYFYMTAKLGGVMNAAKALHVAQPSLSSQLKTLEGALDLALFHKAGRRLELTPDGERVYSFCRKMFEASEELNAYLNANLVKGQRCRIGVTQEIERPFIADVLSSLLKNKQVKDQPLLSMISDDHQDLIDRLCSGELDAIVTTHPVYNPDINVVSKLTMPVVAVVASPLMKKLKLSTQSTLSELLKTKDLGIILPSDCLKIRIETDLYLQRFRPKNPVVFESDILSVVVRATLEGIGLAFLPKHYITKELKQEKLVMLVKGAPLWQNTLYILSRNLKTPNPVISEIKEYFTRLGAQSL